MRSRARSGTGMITMLERRERRYPPVTFHYHGSAQLQDELDVELRRESQLSDLAEVLSEELFQTVGVQILPGVDDPGGVVQELSQVRVVVKTVLRPQQVEH